MQNMKKIHAQLSELKDELDPKNETTEEALIAACVDNSYETLIELDKLLNNHGVETIRLNGSELCYSNTGDSYALTVCLFQGKLEFKCFADYEEEFYEGEYD
jgi:superfamily II RNA helicase